MPKAKYGTFVNGVGVDYSGARLSRTPKFSGVAGVNLDLPLTDLLRMRARGETYHVSTVTFNQGAKYFPDKLSQGGYDLFNANVTFTYDKRFDLTLFARNLTDKLYISGIVDVFQTFQFAEYGRPRELGLEVRVRF
jgi:outer membrane receptor protein involved in Fe transport